MKPGAILKLKSDVYFVKYMITCFIKVRGGSGYIHLFMSLRYNFWLCHP